MIMGTAYCLVVPIWRGGRGGADNRSMTQLTNPRIPLVPVGQEIASFDNYLEASKAVDALADGDFPVQTVTIVGTDLKMVERVTGRLTWGKVLLSAALSGAMFGLMLSLFFVLLVPGAPWNLLAVWAIAGALGFALMQGLAYAMTGGQRDFSSSGQGVVATRYGLQCAPEQVNNAKQILVNKGIIQPAPAPAREIDLTQPPLYGERIGQGEDAPRAEDGPNS